MEAKESERYFLNFALMKKYFFIIFILIHCFAFAQISTDSIGDVSYIKKLINYKNTYPFIKYNINYIEWSDFSAIQPLFNKIQKTKNRKLKILHIGDSHIQADLYTGYIRNRMQQLLGKGGRGFVFPYKAANTHAAYDYSTYCKAKWEFDRNIFTETTYEIGVCGAVVHTIDSSASFKFVFRSDAIDSNFKQLKLYIKKSPQSFDLILKTGTNKTPININCSEHIESQFVLIKLSEISDTLEFVINKKDSTQKFFECSGMLIESDKDNGVLYSSVGINGAGYFSILREKLLVMQLEDYNPDVVVIDLGANDFYVGKFNKEVMQNNLEAIVDSVRKAAPSSVVIISNSQDIYRKRIDLADCKSFSELTRSVAMQKHCAFYDYYRISGGQYSMKKWLANGLAKKDRVHLTTDGYSAKGELFFNAILNSYCISILQKTLNSFIVEKDVADTINENEHKAKEIKNINSEEYVKHIVKSGETLSGIAHKFHISVNKIRKLNKLKTDMIKPGMTLKIIED